MSFEPVQKKVADKSTMRAHHTFFMTKQSEPKTNLTNENNNPGVNLRFGNFPIYPAAENNSFSKDATATCPLKTTPHACPQKIQKKLVINQPGDIYEQEADRVAEVVMTERRMPSWSISNIMLGTVQRQTPGGWPGDQPAPNPNNYEEAAKKTGGAFLETLMETEFWKKLTDAVNQDPLVNSAESFIDTLPGKVSMGALAVGVVSALAATHTDLPAQIPDIPLDSIWPGLSVKITYEGAVDHPTKAAITFSYSPKGEKKTDSKRYRAETARIAAEQEKFRAGMKYKPGSAEDIQQKQEQEAIESYTLNSFGALPGTDGHPLIPTYPVPKDEPHTGLRLPTFESPFQPKTIRLLDQQLELQPLTSSNAPSETEEKEETTPLQRKAESGLKPVDGAVAPSIVDEVLQSSGQPLDAATRAFMEPRFGHDFGQVRVHTDAKAAESARAINAQAYSVGQNVVFGTGQHAPQSSVGQRLLAHELAHVLQQSAPKTIIGQVLGYVKEPKQLRSVHQLSGGYLVQRYSTYEHAILGEVEGLIGPELIPYFVEPETHVVARGEMPQAIAAKYDVPLEFLLARNASLIRGWETPLGEKIYGFNAGERVVIPGDTIVYLASKFGVSEESIADSNSKSVGAWKVPRTNKIIKGFDRGVKVIIPTGKLAVSGENREDTGKNEPTKAQIVKVNGVDLTYGEVITMGDFFRTPLDMLKADPGKLIELRDLIRKQRANHSSVGTEDWQKATGGEYLKLAESNVGHFSPSNPSILASSTGNSGENNKTTWEEYHSQALDAAQLGDKNKALALNGFADHFLTDAFASGHMFNKQDVMNKLKQALSDSEALENFFDEVAKAAWADTKVSDLLSQYETVEWKGVIFRPNIDSPSRFSKLLQGIYKSKEGQPTLLNSAALIVHDNLNKNGVLVENARGDKWQVTGDGYLSKETMKIAKLAVAQSQVNILNAVNSKGALNKAVLMKRVWDYVPAPTALGEDFMKKTILQLTDPKQRATIAAAADIIKGQIPTIVEELVKRHILKKA